MTKTVATLKTQVKSATEYLKGLKVELAEAKAAEKASKASTKALKAQDREAKRLARIAKLEQKLLEMKTPKVGIKAKKASKRPGPVTVTKPVTV